MRRFLHTLILIGLGALGKTNIYELNVTFINTYILGSEFQEKCAIRVIYPLSVCKKNFLANRVS